MIHRLQWRSRTVLLLAVLAQALLGCDTPKPFQTTVAPPETLALLQPTASAGLLIAPMQGIPALVSRRLGGALAEELARFDISASATAGSGQSHILHSSVTIEQPDATVSLVTFSWRLTEPTGLSVGEITVMERLSPKFLLEGRNDILSQIAKRAAPRLEALVRNKPQPAAPTIAAVPARGPLRVALLPIDPAPGDSSVSVARALRSALFRENFSILRDPDDDAFAIRGSIKLREVGSQDEVTIEWAVLDPGGRVLGSVNQGNFVPHGQLSGPWGEIATAVAEGGAAGIAQILRAIDAEAKKQR